MVRKILIDAAHSEETRVVVVNGTHIEEFDFESENKKQIKGNIYLARVTRVEPSLQAAFVEYGESKQGFLAFHEIHPDYYQIPLADRAALLESQKLQAEKFKQKDEESLVKNSKQKNKVAGKAAQLEDEIDLGAAIDQSDSDLDDTTRTDEDKVIYSQIEYLKRYKIQEVIKKRQILLVQILKDERGNKGASLTTYLSLAGRYAVLMPNRSRGGGISRKITDATDRKRLKKIVQELEVPTGMGVILRTAGEKRNKNEIKRDYDYLLRLWDKIRTLTLNSIAPTMVHEESSLIKRCIRDLYDKSISEILVAGDVAYREAKDFMRMLMPSQSKVVQPYKDATPIYSKYNVERQLGEIFHPQVSLPSGGYLIINQTEALVAIDVNSGKSNKESSVENTALQTNLEAAEELSRQLRLRDLAGLIVVDFIDMNDKIHIKAVEKKLKECIKVDRARIQIGHISSFGLLEMSRQRLRSSVLESTTQPCPHCHGTGVIQSDSSSTLQLIRKLETYAISYPKQNIEVYTTAVTAMYILNHKRHLLADMENRFNIRITIKIDDDKQGDISLSARSSDEIVSFNAEAPTNPVIEEPGQLTKQSPRNAQSDRKADDKKPDPNSAPPSEKEERESASSRRRKRRKNQKLQVSDAVELTAAAVPAQLPAYQNKYNNKKQHKNVRSRQDRYKRRVYIPYPEPVGPLAPQFYNLMRAAKLQRRLWRAGLPRVEIVGDLGKLYPEFKEPNNFQQFMYKRYNLRSKYNRKDRHLENSNSASNNLNNYILPEVEFVNLVVPAQKIIDVNHDEKVNVKEVKLPQAREASLDTSKIASPEGESLIIHANSHDITQIDASVNSAVVYPAEAPVPSGNQRVTKSQKRGRKPATASKNIKTDQTKNVIDNTEHSKNDIELQVKSSESGNDSTSNAALENSKSAKKTIKKTNKARKSKGKTQNSVDMLGAESSKNSPNADISPSQTAADPFQSEAAASIKTADLHIQLQELVDTNKQTSVTVSSPPYSHSDAEITQPKKVGWWQRK